MPTSDQPAGEVAGAARPPEGSIGELLDFLLPGALSRGCPPWPPDVFALAASVLQRSSAYARVLPVEGAGLFDAQWPARASRIARRWRANLNHAELVLPNEVARDWTRLVAAARLPLEALAPTASGARGEGSVPAAALLRLLLVADEASADIGWSSHRNTPGGHDSVAKLATQTLVTNDRLSLCLEVDLSKARVLPKGHTPQRGLTLRSLSHHLALYASSEVDARWHQYDLATGRRDFFNLLLLPWPVSIERSAFRLAPSGLAMPERYRLFDFAPSALPVDVERAVEQALAKAREQADRIDAIVFPELALSQAELRVVEAVAIREGLLLMAGIRLDGRDGKAPGNACLVQATGLVLEKPKREEPGVHGTEEKPAQARRLPPLLQRKHHRWCLDRNQILQYGLGGVLPASKDCWENTPLTERRVNFLCLDGWLCLNVLICEDLARQDPVADVIRSIGPGLVVALLMDGPQLAQRWPARYASVLADDPGSSVLTLTSLGMSRMSRPQPGQPDRGRTFAMWRDLRTGTHELTLPDDCDAAVLSIDYHSNEEFTADGRSDRQSSHVPTFAGFRAFCSGAFPGSA